MRHAVLGVGGTGGFLGAALARAGADVLLLMRPDTLSRYPGHLAVESAVLGDFETDVPAAVMLDRDVDVLWVTTKATHLEPALELAPPARVRDTAVIPLLNGIDHMALLRAGYPNVVAGALRVESERLGPGRILQRSPFASIDLAGAAPVAAELQRAGIDCRIRDDELSMLWEKLAFLAPLALATTAFDAPFGDVRGHELYLGCRDEVYAVASAEGARIDENALRTLGEKAPADMRSSMQKDVAGGCLPELDAIAGPVLRGARRSAIPVPATEELARRVAARAS